MANIKLPTAQEYWNTSLIKELYPKEYETKFVIRDDIGTSAISHTAEDLAEEMYKLKTLQTVLKEFLAHEHRKHPIEFTNTVRNMLNNVTDQLDNRGHF